MNDANTGQRSGQAARRLWQAVALLLGAAGLRLHRLDDQNIWWDEGWTLWMARLEPVDIMIRTAVDAHPPLHYLIMHYWNLAAGGSTFAGRLVSVFAGLLMVAGLYQLGRFAGGARVGLLAAGLLTLARFHIWWSQDIKNYTLAGVFTLLSTWLTLRLLRRPAGPRRGRLWAAYVAVSALGLFSHYLAGLVFLANNVFALIWLVRQWRMRDPAWRVGLARWSLAQTVVLALFAPWLALHLRLATTWPPAPPVDFGFFLQLTATVFSLGVTHNIHEYVPLVMLMLALAGLGASGLWRRAAGAPGAGLLAALTVLLPALIVYAASLSPASFFMPQVAPRYLLMFAPAYLLLVAMGVSALGTRWRRLSLTALVIVLAAQAWTVTDYYRARRWTDRLYTLTNVINSFARPGDGVLLHTDHDWPVFLHYLRAPIGWDGVLSGEQVDEAAAAGRAEAMMGRYERIWVVVDPGALAIDPQGLVETALEARLPRQFAGVFGDTQLQLYAPEADPMLEVPAANFRPRTTRQEAMAPGVTLLGYDLRQDEARAGDGLTLATYWQASQPARVLVALQDETGLAADGETQLLAAGTRVRLQTELRLPPDAEGRYTVLVSSGDMETTLGHVTVAPSFSPEMIPIATRTDYALGETIRLEGYDAPQRQVRPGAALPVTLFWQATAPVEASYKVFVHLAGSEWNPASGNILWGQVDRLPVDGNLPTSAWAPGQVVPDGYAVPVDPNAPPGTYWLRVGLYDGLSGERLPVYNAAGDFVGDEITIGEVEVLPPE